MAVVVESVAFLRLYKTCVESHPDLTTGILIGAEEDAHLTVSNAFPLPNEDVASTVEGESAVPEPVGDYLAEYTQSLIPVNADVNVIGCFFAGNVGSTLVEANLKKVYEIQSKKANAVLLTLDLPSFKALRSSVRAFRLSDAMMTYFRSGGLTLPADSDRALVEVPVKLTVSVLLESFIAENLSWITANAKPAARISNYLERNLDILNRSVEETLTKREAEVDTKRRPTIDGYLQMETARLLRCEAVKAARALLEV